MKTKDSVLLIIFLVCILPIYSQVTKTIYISNAGNLRANLTEEEANQITNLTITGKINALDFKVLRDEFPKLETLDLTNVTISFYTGKKGTFTNQFYVYPKDCIPAYGLKDKKTLKKVILSPSIRNLEDFCFNGCDNLKVLQIKKKKGPNLLPEAIDSSLTSIFIPLGSKDEYRNKNEKWKKYNLIEGEPVSISVNVSEPGTLIQKIKEQAVRPEQICFLTIKGNLDRNDFKAIRDDMPQLVSIDLSETTSGIIPEFTFSQKKYLMWVNLPNQLLTIGERAFSGCINLRSEIIIPASVTNIGYGAFLGCNLLPKVVVSNKLQINEPIFGNDSANRIEYR